VTIRQELVGISLELAARRPVFGYGLGRFAAESAPLVSNTLQATWPAASGGENAHNNYLQILVELGAFGLVAFLWFVGAAFGPLAKQAWHRALGPEALGVTAGLLAFLLTCLGGHPLLLPRVLVPFGLFVGVAAGWTPAGSPRPWLRRVAVAAACAVLATAPIRAWQTRQTVDLTGVVIGAEIVDDAPDGSGWRVRNRARWFLPPATRLAVLPIRRTDQTPAPCRAAVLVDDRVVNEVIPTTDGWMNVTVTLEDEGRVGFVPLDIRTDAPACELVAGPLAVR